MAGYAGTDQQMSLQAMAEAQHGWMMRTPGACNTGRFVGTDDPDKLGWNRIFDILERDNICGFRMISVDAATRAIDRLAERGYRIDFWDVFVANREQVNIATSPILATGLPAHFREMPEPSEAEAADTRKIQEFMVASGVAPFSGSMLVGAFGKTTTVAVLDNKDEIAAVAHGYVPHNAQSAYHKYTWGGLVAVSPTHRGNGLGKYVNARMVANCVGALGGEAVYELVAATNIPSRKMVEASGLTLDSSLKSGVAVSGGGRFTA